MVVVWGDIVINTVDPIDHLQYFFLFFNKQLLPSLGIQER